ncbi:MAG: TIR domain-containing protein, partial [Candidatus Angelobacter sp.]
SRIDELVPVTPVTTNHPNSPTQPLESNRKIFIVHGHDHGMKETVARFLGKLGLEPIILHERPDQGRTIIEKFEEHADVAFAVALFSKDDLGSSSVDIQKSTSKPIESLLNSRARQNVVFECGYFIGRLGRKRVAVLHADGVEMMSDYSGVIYIPFDAGDDWRTRLFKELKAAGFNLDANKLFN